MDDHKTDAQTGLPLVAPISAQLLAILRDARRRHPLLLAPAMAGALRILDVPALDHERPTSFTTLYD